MSLSGFLFATHKDPPLRAGGFHREGLSAGLPGARDIRLRFATSFWITYRLLQRSRCVVKQNPAPLSETMVSFHVLSIIRPTMFSLLSALTKSLCYYKVVVRCCSSDSERKFSRAQNFTFAPHRFKLTKQAIRQAIHYPKDKLKYNRAYHTTSYHTNRIINMPKTEYPYACHFTHTDYDSLPPHKTARKVHYPSGVPHYWPGVDMASLGGYVAAPYGLEPARRPVTPKTKRAPPPPHREKSRNPYAEPQLLRKMERIPTPPQQKESKGCCVVM